MSRKKSRKTPTRSGGPSRIAAAFGALRNRAATLRGGQAGKVFGILLAVALLAVVLRLLERHIVSGRMLQVPAAADVRIVNRPDWMPPAVARYVAKQSIPGEVRFTDADLTARIAARSAGNPWVRRVLRVEKHRTDNPAKGLIELKLDFRAPVARVLIDGNSREIFVSGDGVRLPGDQAPRWCVRRFHRDGRSAGKVYYRDRQEVPPGARARMLRYVAIQGVASTPPAPGERWDAPDLADALRLLALSRPRDWFREISSIDVRNHGGRISDQLPHITMHAQHDRRGTTAIYFGRFPLEGGGDYVIAPERKLEYIDAYYRHHNGRLAGLNRYLDVRYDQPHVSIQ